MRDLYPTFIGDLFSCDQLLESMLSRKVLLLHLVVSSCRPFHTNGKRFRFKTPSRVKYINLNCIEIKR